MKRATRGKSSNLVELEEYAICKDMGWTWQALQETPEAVVVAFSQIARLVGKQEQAEFEKVKTDAKTKTRRK